MEENTNLEVEGGREISFAMLFNILKKNILWLLIVTVICGALAGVLTKTLVPVKYSASSIFWVNNVSNNGDYQQSTMVSASALLAENYMQVVTQKVTLEEVIAQHDLDTYLGLSEKQTIDYLRGVITTQHETDTIFFKVTVTDVDANTALKISDSIRDVLPKVLLRIYDKLNQGDGSFTQEIVKVTDWVTSTEDITVVTPPVVRNVILAGAVSFVLVYVLFLVLALLDNLVYGEETLKKNFDCSVLGSVPSWHHGKQKKNHRTAIKKLLKRFGGEENTEMLRDYTGKLIGKNTPFGVVEAFNHIRTNILYSNTAGKTPVYAMTSSIAATGKSVITANLALSFANLGKKTLLLEGDMRCPSFARILGIDADHAGLSELLAGISNSLGDVVIKDYIENLDVLPAGHKPPNPSELLSQEKLGKFLDEWREMYDIILFDMPPYSQVSDAGVVASVIDGYIVICRSEYSEVGNVRSVLHDLKRLNTQVLGFILNDVNPKSAKHSKYGKRYGSYSYYN